MHIARRPAAFGEGETSIFDDVDIESQIAGGANGGFDTMVCAYAAHIDPGNGGGMQAGGEVSACKGAAGSLPEDGFAGQGRGFGLEMVAGLAGPVGGSGFERIVPDVEERPGERTPKGQEGSGAEFGVRVMIANAPGGIVNRSLEIDEDERGGFHGSRYYTGQCCYGNLETAR